VGVDSVDSVVVGFGSGVAMVSSGGGSEVEVVVGCDDDEADGVAARDVAGVGEVVVELLCDGGGSVM